ncbi:MAG: hypothetical protein SPL12_01640 [Bacteroidales bacterium]|nr:hypothetical protein [Bacteroidales bacterium]
MEPLGGEAVGQQHGGVARRAAGLGADALPLRLAIYKYMYAVGRLSAEAPPLDPERTALIHSRFRQPHPRQPPLRKPQPREIHPAAAIRAIRPQFRRASLRVIRIIRRSKPRMVLL